MKGEQQPLELEGPCPICRTCGKKHLFNICVSHVPKYKHDFKHVASVGVAWNAYHVFECRLCSMECTITKKLFRGSGLYLAGLRLKRAMAKFPSAHARPSCGVR